MFYVGTNAVYPEKSEILFEENFTSDFKDRWEISNGEWFAENNVLHGEFRENAGGLIYSFESFDGDVMLDFYGMMVGPCNNDLNFSFKTKGWDYQVGDAAKGYIGGLNGWWTNRSGIERYPECALQAYTSFPEFVSDKYYHIQAGIIGTRLFLAVDGVVIVDMNDPSPINDIDCGRVGIGTYCSRIAVKDFKVMKPNFVPQNLYYTPKSW